MQVVLWKEDFQRERSENERLQNDIKFHQDEMKNFDRMRLQLVQHKRKIANMEQISQDQQREHKAQLEQASWLQQTQIEDVQRQLRKANQQLDQSVTDNINEKLNDNILAKMQEVDGLKAEVENYKSQLTAKQEVSCT